VPKSSELFAEEHVDRVDPVVPNDDRARAQ
jgi:hypothetical protein